MQPHIFRAVQVYGLGFRDLGFGLTISRLMDMGTSRGMKKKAAATEFWVEGH